MTSSPRSKNLIFIIALLLLTNIALLFYVFWWKDDKKGNSGNRDRDGLSGALQKDVGFSTEQLTSYKQMREEHWKVSKPMFEKMQKSRDSLFALVKLPEVTDSTVWYAANRIADQQREMDLRAFYHFKKMRSLCTPDQLPQFDSLLKKISNRKIKPGK